MTNALSIHYAQALADAVFAPNSGLTPEEALRQLAQAIELLGSSQDLHRVLQSPAVPRNRKAALVGKLLDQLSPNRLIRNFLMVIVEHRRSAELEHIQAGFEEEIDKRQGYIRAEIVSAQELTEGQREELLGALGTKAGKFIRPLYKVDKNIVGGVIARFGSREYDGSLAGRLEAMRRRLSQAS